ncbi:hypothetical protein RDI58_020224 [Solanum bulbocastanum]|uniref:Uncharacterized protein n=1 Tax=Solanum bulbocastanum TaxID=147425 RepID=A0AAN8YAG5_SOLBU
MFALESTTKNSKSSSRGTALTRCARIAPSPLALELLTVLTKATLNSIPSHVMQYIKLPAKITNTINKVHRDFMWGTTAEKRKIQLLSWDSITNTKAMGGLGLQKSELKNRVIISSLAWRAMQKPHKL